MNKRFSILLTAILVGLVFFGSGILIAADKPQEVPKEVTIENKDGHKRDKKGPVDLSHEKHVEKYKAACTDCHHEYEDGKNVWKEGDPVKKCSECHKAKRTKENGVKVIKLQNAYHRNCKNCHKKAYKDGNKDIPYRKCNDCHKKK